MVSTTALLWLFYPRNEHIEPASLKGMAFPLPDKPSIAVLPFENMSGDKDAEHAIEVDPKDPSGYQFFGACMSLKGEHDRAIAFCKKAVEIAPNDFQANAHLGTTLMWAEEPESGLVYLELAKRLSPVRVLKYHLHAFKEIEDTQRFAQGLHMAGLPLD